MFEGYLVVTNKQPCIMAAVRIRRDLWTRFKKGGVVMLEFVQLREILLMKFPLVSVGMHIL
jgi:hypothetical protein